VKILVEGRPGSGKTTVARRLVAELRDLGVPVTGFVTEEIREGPRRVGFSVETVGGERRTLAHVGLPGPPRVGKYGVDLATFEEVALPAVEATPKGGAAVIDELGKMELASKPFRAAAQALFDRPVPIVATAGLARHPLTDALRRRSDTEVLRITTRNRDRLPSELAARIASG
jgi:nucleoside-triphosphatase